MHGQLHGRTHGRLCVRLSVRLYVHDPALIFKGAQANSCPYGCPYSHKRVIISAEIALASRRANQLERMQPASNRVAGKRNAAPWQGAALRSLGRLERLPYALIWSRRQVVPAIVGGLLGRPPPRPDPRTSSGACRPTVAALVGENNVDPGATSGRGGEVHTSRTRSHVQRLLITSCDLVDKHEHV